MLEDSRTRDDVQAVFDAVLPPPLGHETRSRAEDLVRKLPDGESVALLGATIDEYTLRHVLGRGGQATVYLAEDGEGRAFAFKVPHRALLDRLIREAQILFHLDHPHVVRVERARVEGDVPYIVTEYLAQGTLADRLRERGRLGADEVQDLGTQILVALGYAHQRGVIHRDLKPSNVLFGADGAVKVADFGIGRLGLVEGLEVAQTLVSADRTQFAGTPLYMAPEQAQAADEVDARADLYALGKLLYEALTGELPRTIKPASRQVPGLHPDWDEFLFTLVEERPSARFASAAQALFALHRIGLGPAPLHPEPSPDAAAAWLTGRAQRRPTAGGLTEALTEAAERSARARLGVFSAGDRIAGYVVTAELARGEPGVSSYLVVPERPGDAARLEILQPGAPPAAAARFLRQAQAAALLPPTPTLVRVLAAGEHAVSGQPYRIVEPEGGEPLGIWLSRHRRIAPATALQVVRDVASALRVAHAGGCLHRNVTPATIRVDRAGPTRLAGIGQGLDLQESLRLGEDGALVGTPLYMAPEIGRVAEIDGRADLYSLGLVWIVLVAGTHPFEGRSALDLLSAKAHRQLPPLETLAPMLPPAHREILARLLAFDRDDRYPDAQALLRDLEALASVSPVPTVLAKPGFWRKLAGAFWPRAKSQPAPLPPAPPPPAPPRSLRPTVSPELGATLSARLRNLLEQLGARACWLLDGQGEPLAAAGEKRGLRPTFTRAALLSASQLVPGLTTLTIEGERSVLRLTKLGPHVLLAIELAPADRDRAFPPSVDAEIGRLREQLGGRALDVEDPSTKRKQQDDDDGLIGV